MGTSPTSIATSIYIHLLPTSNLNYLFILLVSLSTVVLTDEAILVPDNILDVRSGKLMQAQIHIKDGLIQAIAKKIDSKTDIEVIDLKGITLVPGLMDAHVHLIGNN